VAVVALVEICIPLHLSAQLMALREEQSR
jgi:hypothetical protein